MNNDSEVLKLNLAKSEPILHKVGQRLCSRCNEWVHREHLMGCQKCRHTGFVDFCLKLCIGCWKLICTECIFSNQSLHSTTNISQCYECHFKNVLIVSNQNIFNFCQLVTNQMFGFWKN